jgi:inner membrane protein
MGEKYRIKTGTGREKALFFFLVILVVGGVLMNYQVFSLIDTATAIQPTMADNNTTNGSNTKTYINVQVQVDESMSNKNISIKNSQNESNIIVKEINQ